MFLSNYGAKEVKSFVYLLVLPPVAVALSSALKRRWAPWNSFNSKFLEIYQASRVEAREERRAAREERNKYRKEASEFFMQAMTI